MKRDEEFLGSINDFKENAVVLLFFDPVNKTGSLISKSKKFGYAFEKKEDVSEFIELLERLKKRLPNQIKPTGGKYMKNYRHGDLSLIGIKKLPKDIAESKTDVIMKGSHGHDHTVKNAKIYLKQSGVFILGYMKAEKNCILFHPEHGEVIEGKKLREASIEPGVYELRKQCEDTNDGMKPVID